MSFSNLTEAVEAIKKISIPTNTEAVFLYAKEPTEDNKQILFNIIERNADGEMGRWGLRKFVEIVSLMVDEGIVPSQDTLKAIYETVYEADWRKSAWARSPEGQAKLAQWRKEREQG